MDLDTVEPTLLAWVQRVTGVADVVWEDDARPQYVRRLVTCALTSVASKGVDETLVELDEDATNPLVELMPTLAGYRLATLTIQAETRDQSTDATARKILERARIRMRAPSMRAMLLDAGIALVEILSIVNAPYELDERVVSRYALDVRLAVASVFTDPEGATSTITSATVTSTVTDAGGTPLGA